MGDVSRGDAAPPPAALAREAPSPEFLARLSARGERPTRFQPSRMAAKLEAARKFWSESVSAVERGKWKEEQRTRCDDATGTEGVAAAYDERGHIRVLTEMGGTGDSYEQVRYFFDESDHVALIFVTRRDVQGGDCEYLVSLGPTGTVLACDVLELKQGAPRPDLCVDDNPEPAIDPAVRGVLNDKGPHIPHNEMRERLQRVDARAEFDACRP